MPFVTNTWQSVNGDASDANSWTGGVPAANDVCVLDGTSQQSMTTGLGNVTFEQLLVKPSYHGDIGFAGSPWQITLGTGVLVYRGAGRAYINTVSGDVATVIVDIDQSLRSNDYGLILGGMGAATKGSIADLFIKRGRCRVLGDVDLGTDLYILGSGAELLCDVNLGGLTDPVNVYATAGFVENKRPLRTTGEIVAGAGSKVRQIGALLATCRVLVIGNGKFEYLPTSAPGTSPRITILGGVYDQTDEKFDNTWGTTLIGPDGYVIGGAIRGTNLWPPSFDLRDEYPGAQE